MNPQGHPLGHGRGRRNFHIAHRRTPSEMTPMIMEQLALQQQIEQLQQQQQQIAGIHQQYLNMGMLPAQSDTTRANQLNFQPTAIQQPPFEMLNNAPNPGNAVFSQAAQLPPTQASSASLGMHPGAHRRNHSALPGIGLGPPPAPSSGAAYNDLNLQQGPILQARDMNLKPLPRASGPPANAGHNRRHSLALPEAKKAAEVAQQKRQTAGFQFPIPGNNTSSSHPPNEAREPAQAAQGNFMASAPLASQNPRSAGASHGRSQSMAISGARSIGNLRASSGFQFPPLEDVPQVLPQRVDLDKKPSQATLHGRTPSRNFESNWRQHASPALSMTSTDFAPGPVVTDSGHVLGTNTFQSMHRPRYSVHNNPSASLNAYAAATQSHNAGGQQMPPLMQTGQGLVPQAMPSAQVPMAHWPQNSQSYSSHMHSGSIGQNSTNGVSQPQRKSLFIPYLPQTNLPALMSNDLLVAGILRVNKKNRSDAFVKSDDLDADIFICGSKDRNRALEGDLVAIELLDVDEVWSQKRDKEEKKKRKDIQDARSHQSISLSEGKGYGHGNSQNAGGASATAPGESGVRRRGSLRLRPMQKKNDDVEVEGQSVLLMGEEEEMSDEQKPLYAGHVVAIIDRAPGQMFSGTLGLLRPSSQATKDKQDAERQSREGHKTSNDKHQEKPKIVWFKPTDKRVPLIAIPTEQAPHDFVERHQDYANQIFVASIKRWPITSLHPFGVLIEHLGSMGDLKVETDALLRDNNFATEDFSEAITKTSDLNEWSLDQESTAELSRRLDLREENVFALGTGEGQGYGNALHIKEMSEDVIEIGYHTADVSHFVKIGSLLDREAEKRGSSVFLIHRSIPMLPPLIAEDVCSLKPGHERLAISVIFHFDTKKQELCEHATQIKPSIVRARGEVVLTEDLTPKADFATAQMSDSELQRLKEFSRFLRSTRYRRSTREIAPLRLIHQLDDENVPAEHNIFASSSTREILEELAYKVNSTVAQFLVDKCSNEVLLRSHAEPNDRQIKTCLERIQKIGYKLDASSASSLWNGLLDIKDDKIRQALETILFKTMNRARYRVINANDVDRPSMQHFGLSLPLYTHFTSPYRRYADIVVHRQVLTHLMSSESLRNGDHDSMIKLVNLCNDKSDSAQAAQEQSVHIEACRRIESMARNKNKEILSEGIVLCVYESAFDVLLPDIGFEKRVHCDQIPVKKTEFRASERVLELYWEKGVQSSVMDLKVGEDSTIGSRGKIQQQANVSTSLPTTNNDAESSTQVKPGAMPVKESDVIPADKNSAGRQETHRQREPRQFATLAGDDAGDMTDMEQHFTALKLQVKGQDNVQEISELSRVPILLFSDMTKSPPCLTVRAMNPFAQ